MSVVGGLIQLTKPSIILLVAISGVALMVGEGSLFLQPWSMLGVLLATVMAAGSANTLNQYIDRDIDSVMERTKKRRPIPMKAVSPQAALLFGIALGVISTLYFLIWVNWLAALVSLATICFYVFVYTLGLKRRHHYNIVIGGAAGATAPLIASAAATGEISYLAWILFLIIFIWTPPHFWALALALKDDYEKVKVPMLPNVLGVKRTQWEILAYTIVLLPVTLMPIGLGGLGIAYALVAAGVWIWYMQETFAAMKLKTKAGYMRLFYVSIGYLFLLFVGVAVDGLIRHFTAT